MYTVIKSYISYIKAKSDVVNVNCKVGKDLIRLRAIACFRSRSVTSRDEVVLVDEEGETSVPKTNMFLKFLGVSLISLKTSSCKPLSL